MLKSFQADLFGQKMSFSVEEQDSEGDGTPSKRLLFLIPCGHEPPILTILPDTLDGASKSTKCSVVLSKHMRPLLPPSRLSFY